MKVANTEFFMSAGVSNGVRACWTCWVSAWLDDASSSVSESESMSCTIDTKETTNLPPVFCFVFFALVVITKGLEDLKEMTKGDWLLCFLLMIAEEPCLYLFGDCRQRMLFSPSFLLFHPCTSESLQNGLPCLWRAFCLQTLDVSSRRGQQTWCTDVESKERHRSRVSKGVQEGCCSMKGFLLHIRWPQR